MRIVAFLLTVSLFLSTNLPAAPFALLDRWQTGAGPNASTLACDGKYLVVCNSDTDDVTTIEVATGKVLPNVEVGRVPLAITTSSDGKLAFVACFYANALAVVDVAKGVLVKTIDLAVHPRDVKRLGDTIVATGYYEGEVVAVDEKSLKVTSRLPLAQGIHHIAVNEKHQSFYVLNTGRDAIYELTTKPLALKASLGDELEYGGAWDFVLSHDCSTLIVSQWNGNRVAIIKTNPLEVVAFCPTGGVGPCGLDIKTDGSMVAVAQSESDNVALIDVKNASLRAVVPVGRFPFSDVKISADDRYALVCADRNGTIDVIDLDKLERDSQIEVGRTPHVITEGKAGVFYISNTFGGDVVSLVPTGRQSQSFRKLHRR